MCLCVYFNSHSVPQWGSWSPPWPEARRTAGFAGHRCPQLQTHRRTSSTVLHRGMTGEERGGSTRLVRRKTEIKRCDLMIQAGHRIHCQSNPGLSCPERFTCVRTTYPITAYNYNTVKSKIEPRRTSILVLVGYWHARHQAGCRLPDYEWLYHLQHIAAALL